MSRSGSARLDRGDERAAHAARRLKTSRVALNLDGNGSGGDVVVLEGTADIDRTAPSAADNLAYLDKYRPVMDEYGWTPEWFAARYSVPIRITPSKYRYW